MRIGRRVVLISAVLLVSTILGQTSVSGLYNQVGTLKGQVVVHRGPSPDRLPATGGYFLLQRVTCRECLIGVQCDFNGRYSVFLGAGRYRVYYTDVRGGGAS